MFCNNDIDHSDSCCLHKKHKSIGNMVAHDIELISTNEVSNFDEESKIELAEMLVNYVTKNSQILLLFLADDQSELVRINACDSLSVFNDSEVVERLKNRAIHDKSSIVRGYAVLSLGDIGNSRKNHRDDINSFLKQSMAREKTKWTKYTYYRSLYCLSKDVKFFNSLVDGIKDIRYKNRLLSINLIKELCRESMLSDKDIIKVNDILSIQILNESTKSVLYKIDELKQVIHDLIE